MNNTNVVKRSGSLELLDLDKLHIMVEEACRGLAGVSASQVEMQSGLQFYDGISTSEIQDILIKSAADLIDLDHPNYQFVAARLLLFSIRKKIFGKKYDHPNFYDHVVNCVNLGVYDSDILDWYSKQEFEQLEEYIDHDRDYLFTYSGLRQAVDKYLVQDRLSGILYETPQMMYMLIAATGFHKYPKDIRLNYVRRYYNAISRHKINIPTPIMSGVREPLKQYASCVLVDVGDDLDSIGSSDYSILKYVAQRAGIGINSGRIRGINSKIKGGKVISTGMIPYLKKFEGTVRSCTQNGVRGGSATVNFPIWHQEIEDLIVLKNNKGTDDNRVRKLDYCVQLSKLFYLRFIQNKNITLFSPNNVPGLYEAFGFEEFDNLYEKYENDPTIPKKIVNAQELIGDLLRERAETGRIYIMNMDHCNSHSSFIDPIRMTNLCTEITLPTVPMKSLDDENSEIALCILSAINLSKIKHFDDLEDLCDIAVRFLDELIDHQDYPIKCAEIATKSRRSLGIGFIGLAHYLAKNEVKYDDPEAWKLVHDLTEAFQYYLIKASIQLAKEKGPCAYYDRTKYSQGILPIDTYKKDVDEIVPNKLNYDWDYLRAELKKYGIRNSTLSAQMPSESSSVVSNTTNGIEPPRDFLSIKKSKKTPLRQIVPQYQTLKNHYTLLWDMPSNSGYINIVAVMQKFFDQAISGNWSYNPENYADNKVPVSVITEDFLKSYKYGWKTSYYHNTYDVSKDSDELNKLLTTVDDEENCDSCTI